MILRSLPRSKSLIRRMQSKGAGWLLSPPIAKEKMIQFYFDNQDWNGLMQGILIVTLLFSKILFDELIGTSKSTEEIFKTILVEATCK